MWLPGKTHINTVKSSTPSLISFYEVRATNSSTSSCTARWEARGNQHTDHKADRDRIGLIEETKCWSPHLWEEQNKPTKIFRARLQCFAVEALEPMTRTILCVWDCFLHYNTFTIHVSWTNKCRQLAPLPQDQIQPHTFPNDWGRGSNVLLPIGRWVRGSRVGWGVKGLFIGISQKTQEY